MIGYNVRLTEREVKDLGERRWQKASWRRWCFYALTSVALFMAGIVLTLRLTEIGDATSNIGIIASGVPVLTFASWFLVRLRSEGRNFLERVKYESMLEGQK